MKRHPKKTPVPQVQQKFALQSADRRYCPARAGENRKGRCSTAAQSTNLEPALVLSTGLATHCKHGFRDHPLRVGSAKGKESGGGPKQVYTLHQRFWKKS